MSGIDREAAARAALDTLMIAVAPRLTPEITAALATILADIERMRKLEAVVEAARINVADRKRLGVGNKLRRRQTALVEAGSFKNLLAALKEVAATDDLAEAYLAPERIAAQAEWADAELQAKYDRLLVAAEEATAFEGNRELGDLDTDLGVALDALRTVVAEAKGEARHE